MSIASPELCAFVRKQAPPHYATSEAPSTWPELQAWYQRWQDQAMAYGTCYVLPVFDGGCEHTIYDSVATNHAFRAWHDNTHLANGLSFSRKDEIAVGRIQIQQARAAGLSKRALDLISAETIGQIEFYYYHGAYVNRQSDFARDVLKHGLTAVLDSGVKYT